MQRAREIPVFREINECHQAAGLPLRSDLADFHVFTLEETCPATRQTMPPYRRGFFQLTYIESLGSAKIQLDGTALHGAENSLVFSPPEQVLSWVCGGAERGFVLYFKPELFPEYNAEIEEAFPFFAPSAMHVVSLTGEDGARLHGQLARLREVFHSRHPYRRQQLAALTTALLYDCRALHEQQDAPAGSSQARASKLVARFRQLVAHCFQDHCSVESYANHLHVSADHLGAVLRKHTGRTARNLIDERVLLEAMRLLANTDLTASEIASHLDFSEPTHFVRFFKRHTGQTPLTYRQSVRTTGTSVSAGVAAGRVGR